MRGSGRSRKWSPLNELIMPWGKLSEDDLDQIAGGDRFVARLQSTYGGSTEEAQRRADEWLVAPVDRPGELANTVEDLRQAALLKAGFCQAKVPLHPRGSRSFKRASGKSIRSPPVLLRHMSGVMTTSVT